MSLEIRQVRLAKTTMISRLATHPRAVGARRECVNRGCRNPVYKSAIATFIGCSDQRFPRLALLPRDGDLNAEPRYRWGEAEIDLSFLGIRSIPHTRGGKRPELQSTLKRFDVSARKNRGL